MISYHIFQQSLSFTALEKMVQAYSGVDTCCVTNAILLLCSIFLFLFPISPFTSLQSSLLSPFYCRSTSLLSPPLPPILFTIPSTHTCAQRHQILSPVLNLLLTCSYVTVVCTLQAVTMFYCEKALGHQGWPLQSDWNVCFSLSLPPLCISRSKNPVLVLVTMVIDVQPGQRSAARLSLVWLSRIKKGISLTGTTPLVYSLPKSDCPTRTFHSESSDTMFHRGIHRKSKHCLFTVVLWAEQKDQGVFISRHTVSLLPLFIYIYHHLVSHTYLFHPSHALVIFSNCYLLIEKEKTYRTKLIDTKLSKLEIKCLNNIEL